MLVSHLFRALMFIVAGNVNSTQINYNAHVILMSHVTQHSFGTTKSLLHRNKLYQSEIRVYMVLRFKQRYSYPSNNMIPNIFSHFSHPVHISVDLRCCSGDDRGLSLPAQTAHWLHQEGQQRRLPGQSSCSLGSGSGDRASTQTGDALHVHTLHTVGGDLLQW